MNQAGPELRDIHLPPDPSWWPPAPGWWIVALICLALLATAAVRIRRRMARQRWKRRVLAELDRIASEYSMAPDELHLTAEISQLLRRASRLLDPAAPALHGEAWLGFLDSTLGSEEFSKGAGRVILEGPYQRTTSCDAEALLGLTRRWLQCALERNDTHV